MSCQKHRDSAKISWHNFLKYFGDILEHILALESLRSDGDGDGDGDGLR